MGTAKLTIVPIYKKPIPLYLFILISIFGFSATWFFLKRNSLNTIDSTITNSVEIASPVKLKMIRMKGNKLSKPLLMVDNPVESSDFNSLKLKLKEQISQYKSGGNISDISIYVRELSHGDWMSIDENLTYPPGSIMKVAILITWLKMSEGNPGLLDKKIFFEKSLGFTHMQTYDEGVMTEQKNYSVKELLSYMIVNSDNDATWLLQQRIDLNKFKLLFENLGYEAPDINNPYFEISVVNYARFFRLLYNSTYLTETNSEFALELLSKSHFKEGMTKYLPADLIVAHKFGERFNNEIENLHEAGVVYLKDKDYLVGIMTKGKNTKQQTEAVSTISKTIYDFMVTKAD